MKKYIYLFIIASGLSALFICLVVKDATVINICLSIGSGLLTSGLTAGLVDMVAHLDFVKKRKYRRAIELHQLSLNMLIVAQLVLNQPNNKNVEDIINKISEIKITEDNRQDIIQAIEIGRGNIEKELETIRKIQDYLSLSGYFDDKEIVFLCRSINYYRTTPTRENVNYVLDNIRNYFKMFYDTFPLRKNSEK